MTRFHDAIPALDPEVQRTSLPFMVVPTLSFLTLFAGFTAPSSVTLRLTTILLPTL